MSRTSRANDVELAKWLGGSALWRRDRHGGGNP